MVVLAEVVIAVVGEGDFGRFGDFPDRPAIDDLTRRRSIDESGLGLQLAARARKQAIEEADRVERRERRRAGDLRRFTNRGSKLPDKWQFYVDNQNTYDGAYFGTKILFEEGQCASNLPCMTEGDVDDFLKRDFSRPLANPCSKSAACSWMVG